MNRGALEHAQEVRRRCSLPAQRSQRMHLGEEAVPRPLESLERDGTGDVRGAREAVRTNDAERAERGHELRSVHEREALFRG